jgi:hypothetical protein
VRLRYASLTPGHYQVALDYAEWDGMTDIAHIIFTQPATPLPPAPALRRNRPDKSKDVAPSTPERALPGKRDIIAESTSGAQSGQQQSSSLLESEHEKSSSPHSLERHSVVWLNHQ